MWLLVLLAQGQMLPNASLAPSKRALASLMRHLPAGVRRVRVWRDKVYQAVGAAGWAENDAVDQLWPSELQTIRGRLSGMKMALDLTDWSQRRTYFTGRYYQEDLEDLLSALLRPGDNFVDVGANIGLVTLHAAAIIRNNLWSFEPNPEVYRRLMEHIEMNALDGRRVLNKGLGKERATLSMKLFGRHTGKATLVELQPGSSIRAVPVEVCRGDEALSELDTTRPTVIKIDVEGFEVPVLEGLEETLNGDVAVVIEVSRSWLERAGNSAEQLHSMLESRGLKPHCFELQERRIGRSLVVKRIDGPLAEEQYDCLFMRPTSVFADRLRKATTFR
jgi:FkbM family methyltransferase